MPKSSRKPPNRTATRKPVPAGTVQPHPRSSLGYEPQRLKAPVKTLGGVLEAGTPDMLVNLLPPLLWQVHAEGQRGNHCVDAAFTLRYAYAQLGIRSQLLPVDLVIRDGRGEMVMHGSATPGWSGEQYTGHCILALPDSGRFIDATAEQYPLISRLKMGPVMGRAVTTTGNANGEGMTSPGAVHGVQRGDLLLVYTVAAKQYATVIEDEPRIRDAQPEYRRTGVNLASHVLAALRHPDVIERARMVPNPRLQALLDVLGDTIDDADATDSPDWFHMIPDEHGVPQRLRLDEIPLPEGTPPEISF